MIEKEIDGITYYCFEPSEEEAQKRFERAVTGDEVIKTLTKAYFDAIAEWEYRQRNAWRELMRDIPELESIVKEHTLAYSSAYQGFLIQEKTQD